MNVNSTVIESTITRVQIRLNRWRQLFENVRRRDACLSQTLRRQIPCDGVNLDAQRRGVVRFQQPLRDETGDNSRQYVRQRRR